MKNYLLLLGAVGLLTFASCEAEDDNYTLPATTTTTKPVDTPTTPAADPADTAGAWSDFSPSFDGQTEDFTQTRTREVTVNGNDDGLAKEESRNVTVSSVVATIEANERGDNTSNSPWVDVNDDGDGVDYYEISTTTYTASIGGSFTVEADPVITLDQELNFLTANYGVWSNVREDNTLIPVTITYEDGYIEEVYTAIGWDVLDESIDTYVSENGTCFVPVAETDTSGLYVSVDELTIDSFKINTYGLNPTDFVTQESADLLATYGVYEIGIYNSFGIVDYEGVSAIHGGQAIYAQFSDGSQYVFYTIGTTMEFYGAIDASEFTCDTTTGKSSAKTFAQKIGVDASRFNIENRK